MDGHCDAATFILSTSFASIYVCIISVSLQPSKQAILLFPLLMLFFYLYKTLLLLLSALPPADSIFYMYETQHLPLLLPVILLS